MTQNLANKPPTSHDYVPQGRETVQTLLAVTLNHWENYLASRNNPALADISRNDYIRARTALHCTRMARIHLADRKA